MRKLVSLAALACAASMATGAEAAQIFKQTFAGGLTAQEQVSGGFQAKNGVVGHTTGGYRNYEYSYYQLSLDLTQYLDAFLAFDYDIVSEARYDGFNVVASDTGVFEPKKGLLTPTTAGVYAPMSNSLSWLGDTGVSGTKAGRATFDLSQFAGRTVDLRFQFQSDYFATGRGLQLDNLVVTGTPVAGVPEPATWAMMILGFGAAGSVLRRRRMALV